MTKHTLLFTFLLAGIVFTGTAREKRSVVRLETTAGILRVALYDETPLHRDNFLKLAEEAYYDSTLFHRVIKNFMIQGGDPDSRHAEPGKKLGEGGPDYTLPAEILYPDFYHLRGALAMAREGDDVNPEWRSSGSQFYIVWGQNFREGSLNRARAALFEKSGGTIDMDYNVYNDYLQYGGAPHLDGSYTVFGEIIEGQDVVKQIQLMPTDEHDRPLEDVILLRAVVEQRSKKAGGAH